MPEQTGPFTFLQVSDVHLDSKLASLRLALPVFKRIERSKEILATLLKTLELARERSVDAVLIPGDLWDSESVSSQTINKLAEALGDLAPIPVLIAPGNHDYYSAQSLYNSDVLAAKGMRTWPANVRIFDTSSFKTWRHPARADVSFTGRAFTGNVPVSERLLAADVPRDQDAAVNILVFHGSLDGYTGGDSGWPGKSTAPFSANELERLGFTYAAVGHYHDYTRITAGAGRLLGAYAGCLCGRGVDEQGPRHAVMGTIDSDGHTTIEPIEVDRRRVVSVVSDITGSTSAEVLKDTAQLLEQAGARQQTDIVYVRLEGRHPVGGEPTYVHERFAESYYHLVVDDQTRADYLTERFDRRTTEGRFIQAMLDMKKQASEAGGYLVDNSYDCELSEEVIEDALYYGLDALKQKRVAVRNVD